MIKLVNRIIGILVCLSTIQPSICAEEALFNPEQTGLSFETVKDVGEQYINFMGAVGQSEKPVTFEDVSRLFHQDCEKFENGSQLFNSAKDLPEQLMNARRVVGKWTIRTLFMTASSHDRSCTIQFVWHGENMPEHTTMVTLFIDNAKRITQIHEAYNLYQGKTLA